MIIQRFTQKTLKRKLSLFEHVAMDLLENENVPVPRRKLITKKEDVENAFKYHFALI